MGYERMLCDFEYGCSLVLVLDAEVFPGGSDGKEFTCQCQRCGFDPGLGRSSRKGMTTHSSILAWRIPWTEEPGRLQSMGSQRVRYDFVAKEQQQQ